MHYDKCGKIVANYDDIMVRLFPFPEIRVTLLSPTKAKRVAEYAKTIFRLILFFDKVYSHCFFLKILNLGLCASTISLHVLLICYIIHTFIYLL